MDFSKFGVGSFIAGSAVAALFLVFAPEYIVDKPCGDCEGGYVSIARNLSAGSGFIGLDGELATARPPGNAIFLLGGLTLASILNTDEIIGFRLANIILFGLISATICLFARTLWDGVSAVAVTSLWVSCPFTLFFLTAPYSELPFIFIYVLLFMQTTSVLGRSHDAKYWKFLLIGVLCGTAMMIRPLAIGIPIIIAILLLVFSRPLATKRTAQRLGIQLLGVLTGVLLMTAPWSYYVFSKTSDSIFLTDGTLTRNSLVNGFTFASRGEDYRIPIFLPPEARRLMNSIEQELTQLSSQTHDNEEKNSIGPIVQLIVDESIQNQAGALQLLAVKVVRSWYGTDSHRYETLSRTLISLYGFLVVAGLILGARRSLISNSTLLLTLALTAYFWMMCIVFEPLVRYLVPHLGVLFLFIPGIWQSARRQGERLSRH